MDTKTKFDFVISRNFSDNEDYNLYLANFAQDAAAFVKRNGYAIYLYSSIPYKTEGMKVSVSALDEAFQQEDSNYVSYKPVVVPVNKNKNLLPSNSIDATTIVTHNDCFLPQIPYKLKELWHTAKIMALPTMSGYWSSRKNMYEQAIVRHRNHEDNLRSQWTETANYFKNSDVWAAKQNAWSSKQGFQDSMDAYKESKSQDLKSMKLKQRKDKLALLLSEDNKNYTAELKGLSKPNFERLEEMRAKTEGIKSAREEKRQKLAEDKLYQHWRENNSELRKAESHLLQEHVIGEWGDQIEEKEERLESARQEKLAFEKQMEKERLDAIKLERQREEERRKEERSMKDMLRQQMLEFKAREEEAKAWIKQQEDLLRQKWELEKIEDQQRKREEERKKQDLGRALLRQHKAQMMHKSKVIQEELEQDRKLLQSLIEKENEQISMQSARREKAKADAHWMKQVIEDQLRLEKAREAELDMLYQDEAARMWQKRASEWERERQARQKLMAEVLENRQEQIALKLAELQQQQEESLQRREELVKEMEIAQQMTRREEEEQKLNKLATKGELEEQIRARQLKERQEELNLQLELDEEREEEKGYEELLKQETERMRLKGFTPRDHGRRQAWM